MARRNARQANAGFAQTKSNERTNVAGTRRHIFFFNFLFNFSGRCEWNGRQMRVLFSRRLGYGWVDTVATILARALLACARKTLSRLCSVEVPPTPHKYTAFCRFITNVYCVCVSVHAESDSSRIWSVRCASVGCGCIKVVAAFNPSR